MTLIEGVGDEVTDFFIVVGVLFVGWIAWCSTNISEQPLIRTVLILQHRTRTRIAELRANTTVLNDNFNSRTSSSEESTASEETVEPISRTNDESDQTCLLENQNAPETSDNSTPLAATGTASEETLIAAMDAATDERESTDEAKLENSDSTETNITETTPISVPAFSTSASAVDSIDGRILDDADEITIKLKFINDDQKVVTGKPKEMLGDFKRRHFQEELEAQKRVRLVFNGHVLQPDSETLEQCGLYNNCVVHCLVHQPRLSPTNSSNHSSSVDSSSSIYSNPQAFQNMQNGSGISSVHNEWDLSRLLVSIVTLILAFAWYSRYNYAQLFTATTTLALYALTAIFTLSVVGHFFPDQDSLRNIE